MNKFFLFIFLTLVSLGTVDAHGQYIGGQLSKKASVSILTVGPAEPAYTMFGHTAIRVQDPVHKIDKVYNYGTFDFESPNFHLRFLHGDLKYYLSTSSFEAFKKANVALGRSIVSQTLNLSTSQTNKFVKALEQKALPENRSYQYKFFRQNCVTKVRDVLENLDLWSSFEYSSASVLSADTYRQQLSDYLTHRPWMRLGINLMLGVEADKPITIREKSFLPNTMHLTLANSFDKSGQPIVASSETIARASIQKQENPLPPVFVFWTVFLAVIAFTATSLLRGWDGRWVDQLLFGAIGIVGFIIAFGSFISVHQPLHYNWNLLWVLPTHLLVATGLPWFRPKWMKIYFLLTLILDLALIIGWAFIPQQIPLAVIPLVGALIARSMYRFYIADRAEVIATIMGQKLK